jgi:hypothetical protein
VVRDRGSSLVLGIPCAGPGFLSTIKSMPFELFIFVPSTVRY